MRIASLFVLCVLAAGPLTRSTAACAHASDSAGATLVRLHACQFFLSVACYCYNAMQRGDRLRNERDRCLNAVSSRKRRKVETDKRVYYWEEDGHTGLNRVRCSDPHNAPPWERFLVPPSQLGVAKQKDFRELFRIPHSLFWEILDAAKGAGVFPDENLNTSGTGRGTPLKLGLKVSPRPQLYFSSLQPPLCMSVCPLPGLPHPFPSHVSSHLSAAAAPLHGLCLPAGLPHSSLALSSSYIVWAAAVAVNGSLPASLPHPSLVPSSSEF